MRFCKHSGKREVCSNISLLQETRDPSKKQSNLIHKASRKKYKKSQKNLKINGTEILKISSVQFSSVAQSCLIFCDPMNRRTPSLPVHHQLPEFTQTRVHQVSDAIQPSHPQSSPSSPALNPSQHQSLFQ